MRYFFDTEFLEDGHTIELLSIGIVADDGREYYAEVTPLELPLDRIREHEWLMANVIPHLSYGSDPKRMHIDPRIVKHRSTIAKNIIEFVGDKPEFWAYFADYDWVVLCQLFGRMIDLPSGWPMYCRDLKQFLDQAGMARSSLPPQEGAAHNALADARWVKDAFEFTNDNIVWELRY